MSRSATVDAQRSGVSGRWHALVLIPLVLSAWVYHPILRVNFFADDFVHLADIESTGILDFLLAPFGGHNYLARNLVFLTSWELFGLHAPFFYLTVLANHLLNVALLFAVIRAMSGGTALACFGASLWGTLPLCRGTLGWYSVHGQVLSATILLVVLVRLLQFANVRQVPSVAELCLWYALLLVGTTCFGVGVGIALAFPAVLFLLLPAAWSRVGVRVAWLLLPLVTIGLYFGLRRLYVLVGTMTLSEAIQERVAIDGLAAAPTLLAHLLTFSVAGSVLGFFMPNEFPSPAAGLAVAGVVAGLGILAVRGEAGTLRRVAALVALGVGIYLVIAVGRGQIYVMFKMSPTSAAKVARYHYAGTLPIVVLLCLVLQELGRLPALRRIPAPLALCGGLASIVAGRLLVGLPIEAYPWTKTYVQQALDATVASVRTWPSGAVAYVENDKTPRGVLGAALPNAAFPGRAAVFILVNPTDQLEGRTVRFVERDPEVLEYYAARPQPRLARLLVAPEQMPASP